MDGTTTGFGANILIIDDPIRSLKDAESKHLKDSQYDWFDAVADMTSGIQNPYFKGVFLFRFT